MAEYNPFEGIFDDVLDAVPQAGYTAQLQKRFPLMGPQSYLRRYYDTQYQPLLRQYMGQSGQQIAAGQDPQRYTDFLSEFPFRQSYAAAPPSLTGRVWVGSIPGPSITSKGGQHVPHDRDQQYS